jgi:ApbE superfamily uncharacterized protein (UPF0280 family)
MNVRLLKEGVALVDSGPLYATIHVSAGERPLSEAAIDGGNYALKILEQLAAFLPVIKSRSCKLYTQAGYPPVVNDMISATQATGDPDFTPMAAVAGAIADLVADYVTETTDATRIMINNGGDISIRLKDGNHVRVGLCTGLAASRVDYFLSVDKDCGICTSGFGGRSFTLGIASAVTVLAGRASLADAFATYIGNKTSIDAPNIKRERADSLDPDTDIPGKDVTTFVGDLSDAETERALQNGWEGAIRFLNNGTIDGAVIAVKRKIVTVGVIQLCEFL